MATKKKSTLKEQYSLILAGVGVRLDECSTLAFLFPREGASEKFHYSLLTAEPAVPYLIFDSAGARVQVVVRQNPMVEGRVRAMAEVHGGRKTLPE